MKKSELKKFNLPDKPGVYFFLDGKGEVLYIGKATSLRDRVRSYFSKDLIATRGPLIVDMVFKAKAIKHETTDSVLEALILEANLIKKYQPHFNTKEKDDKSFNYVCITKEKLPKVVVRRGKDLVSKDFKKVFGPFTNGSQLREALKIIRRIFPFLDEKSKQYHEFYRQLELVPNTDERKKYLNNIRNIALFFEGKKKTLVKALEKEMKGLAKEERFEDAQEVKKKIFALGHINDIALIKKEANSDEKPFRIEAYDIAHTSGKDMVGVMVVMEGGEANKSEYRKFRIRTQSDANDTGALQEVLERRFKKEAWAKPNLIVLDGSTAQINVAKKVLKDFDLEIPIVSVVKDERHRAREIKGLKTYTRKYEREILLINQEAHRFAITYHKSLRDKSFIKKKK